MGKNRKESYMKILKKTLAVALVLVLALGMVPLMTGAADYTDHASIEYKEEVEVLTGIGVVEGYDAGTFQPTRNVTRAQACAIVARLMLTRAIADSLPVDSTGFKDVPVSHWAANYIAFCVSEGIVVGYGDGRFGPNNDVKGSEFAIMIMRALGTGDAKRWEGANWQMFAILDGQSAGILTTGVNYTRPATREETAVYAFNGLLFSPSGKSSEMIYAIVRFELETKDGITYMVPVYDWIPVSVIAKDSIASTVYPTLKKTENDFDDLGRPSRIWVFGKPAKPISVAAAAPAAVIEGNVTQGALFTATSVGANSAGEVPATVNMKDKQITATLTSLRNGTGNANGDIYKAADTANNPPNGGSTGRGNITEIYIVDNKPIAVVIVPSFAKIANIESKAAGSGVGARTVYTIDAKNTGEIFTAAETAYDTDTLVLDGTVAKGDWVLYYKGEHNLYINAVDILEGVLSAVTSAGAYTVGGETLRLAQAYQKVDRDPVATTAEQKFYVDAWKNILGVAKSPDAAAQIAFVFGVDSYAVIEDGRVVTKYFADIIDLAGKVDSVPVIKEGNQAPVAPAVKTYGYDNLKGHEGVYQFTVSGTGVYTFRDVVSPLHLKNDAVVGIEKGSVTLDTANALKNVNNSTIFAIVNFEDGDPDGTVTLYNRNTVPSLEDLEETWAVSVGSATANANLIADIVYVFDNVYESEYSSFVFLLSSFTQTAAGKVYDIVVKGEKSTVTVPDADLEKYEDSIGYLVDSITVKGDGQVIVGDEVEDNGTTIIAYFDTDLYYDDGLLVDDDGVIGAIEGDTPIYIFEIGATKAGGADFDAFDAEDLDEELADDDIAFVIYNKAGDIIAIYILFYV